MNNKLKNFIVKYIPKYLVDLLITLWRFYRIVILKDKEQYNLREWHRDKGDEVLRLKYDINSESIVFDLGGYMGDFTEEISKRYSCTIYLFEPVKAYYDICILRFKGNDKIKCNNFGLSSIDKNCLISVQGSSSRIIKNISSGERVSIVDISRYIDENDIENINLLKINIEGGEYDILDRLITTGLIKKCKYLQIQFHSFVENAVEKRNILRERLCLTHRECWCFPFLWESWERLEN